MITKEKALISLRPNAEWIWRGNNYSGLEWLDKTQSKPSESEIAAEITRLQSLEPARIAEASRKMAYINESDPLFFKAQRGEATMEEWQAKVAEIKSRFPKE